MLSGIELRNFRAHRHTDIGLAPLTAIVGPNGAGKSAVLRAIDLVLGERWPSLASLRLPQDFADFDTSTELSITANFARPLLGARDRLGKQALVHSLQVRCRPYQRAGEWGSVGDPNFDFRALDAMGAPPMECVEARTGQKPEFRPLLGVSGGLRQQAPCLLIDHQRGVSQQMPWTRGSVLLKLLQPARRELDDLVDDDGQQGLRRDVFNSRFAAAMEVLRSPHVSQVEQAINETTQRTLGFLGRSRRGDVSVGFGIADPTNPLHSFRLVLREHGREIPAEEAGLGVQSAIVVGLFEALRQTRAQTGIVLIDEPEMYLHPQAQRYFHRLLVEMADAGQAQVIYSTHSPVFAEAHRFETLRLLRRNEDGVVLVGEVAAKAKTEMESDRSKLLVGMDAARSEALFADAVLLVEGPGDQLAARAVAEHLNVDLDAENLSVVACGGKTSIPYYARLCRALGVPTCVLFDEDVLEEPAADDQTPKASKRRQDNARAVRETQLIKLAVPDPRHRFMCSPNLETALGVTGRRDKPARTLAAVNAAPGTVPEALSAAVLQLADFVDAGPPPF